ncbi:hypothetical protein IBTHAUMO2_450074 [Nitrosopumilaceae archaeon]|nr:hypothetical protein IBTHAUMO2_450074 [Nitrosopumilaceae archaeon]
MRRLHHRRAHSDARRRLCALLAGGARAAAPAPRLARRGARRARHRRRRRPVAHRAAGARQDRVAHNTRPVGHAPVRLARGPHVPVYQDHSGYHVARVGARQEAPRGRGRRGGGGRPRPDIPSRPAAEAAPHGDLVRPGGGRRQDQLGVCQQGALRRAAPRGLPRDGRLLRLGAPPPGRGPGAPCRGAAGAAAWDPPAGPQRALAVRKGLKLYTAFSGPPAVGSKKETGRKVGKKEAGRKVGKEAGQGQKGCKAKGQKAGKAQGQEGSIRRVCNQFCRPQGDRGTGLWQQAHTAEPDDKEDLGLCKGKGPLQQVGSVQRAPWALTRGCACAHGIYREFLN